MKSLLYLFLLLLTLFNLYLCSTLVRNGELDFYNDVARDFLLLQELDEKKIVLIGPRTSTSNLFHGPIWSYINYPAYVLGNGNPVVVAWFWILLVCIFLLTSFFMVRKFFGTLAALVFCVFVSIRTALQINNLFHAEATFFFAPMFFFTIVMYIQSKKSLYLGLHFLALAILIQLEIGVGLQFFILSTILVFLFIVKNKLWKHLLAFSLLPVFLSNLILFDLRHNLSMAKALFSTGKALQFFIPFQSWLENRMNNIISLQLLEGGRNDLLIFVIFGLVVGLTILEIKNKSKHKDIYILFLFYYFGYILTSFFNKGILLSHYTYLLIPLTALWLVSFLSGKYKILFLFLIAIVFFRNLNYVNVHLNVSKARIGNHYNSWKALSSVAQEVIDEQKGEEFGYFVFAPDALAYQPRYAMLYHFKTENAKAFEYTKKSTTYVIAAPPPANDIYMDHVWWRRVPVKILSEPVTVKKFPSGFTIERFTLSKEEQNVRHDKTIELGIHFR